MVSRVEGFGRTWAFAGAALAVLILAAMASNSAPIQIARTGGAPITASLEVVRGELPVQPDDTPQRSAPAASRTETPGWLAWPVGAAVAAAAVWFLSRQRFGWFVGRWSAEGGSAAEASLSEQDQAEAIASFADGLISELELGPDPRLAIRRAYAAVETGFGTRELARKPTETPLRYLDRVFGRRRAAAEPLAVLTDRFQFARFGVEPVTETMRTEAVAALVEIRDEYERAARARVGL